MSDWAKGLRFSPMASRTLALPPRFRRPGPAAALIGGALIVLAAAGAMRLTAQVEGDRGIIPVKQSSDIHITGIDVEVTADNAEEARLEGWQLAARKAWEKAGGPAMADGQIQGMVAAVVIEREQIGPKRYIAKLGVIFDRSRAGEFIGGGEGGSAHSAPMLTIPVLHSGGVAQVYEVRGPWQQAWASFQAGTSPIDYVRPTGAGGESLLITAGQPGRRSRAWWRNVLDQFGAADVLVPEARLERQWPGGPVRGTFTARYGPDNKFLESFTMSANDEDGLTRMLAEAVVRLDAIYARALSEGLLKPDATLNVRPQIDPALAALIAAGQAPLPTVKATTPQATASATPTPEPTKAVEVRTFTIQFSSPDAAAVDAALGAVRGVAGVQGASTTSLAVGGTSLMRVSYQGELSALADALRARGWRVNVGNNALSIKR